MTGTLLASVVSHCEGDKKMTNIKLNQNIDELEPDLVSKRDELDNEMNNSMNALLNEKKGLVIVGGNSESLNYLTTKNYLVS